MRLITCLLVIIILYLTSINCDDVTYDVTIDATVGSDVTISPHASKSELANTLNEASDNELLLVSTINGAIYIVSQSDGSILWQIPEQEFPVLKLPQQIIRPLFVANPRDGGLYRMGVSTSGRLEKLDLGIPEMVSGNFVDLYLVCEPQLCFKKLMTFHEKTFLLEQNITFFL